MVRVAEERIAELFALAEQEAVVPTSRLPDRYVRLARRIGTRYNVRLLAAFRERYCRSCSAYWVEGRTVRTRLRSGRRVRTCLRCERERRVSLGVRPQSSHPPPPEGRPRGTATAATAETVEDDEEPCGTSEEG